MGNIKRISKLHRIIPSAQFFSQNENFVNISKKLLKNWNWTFPVVPNFTRKIGFVSNIFPKVVDAKAFSSYFYKKLYNLKSQKTLKNVLRTMVCLQSFIVSSKYYLKKKRFPSFIIEESMEMFSLYLVLEL